MADGLVVVENAQGVRQAATYDGSVEYFVEDPYPGSIVIRLVSDRLRAKGWSETDQWIGPDGSRGASRTWSRYLDGNDEVQAWTGSWTNRNRDLVTYFLSYRTSVGERAVRLQIKAIRMTAQTVERLRR